MMAVMKAEVMAWWWGAAMAVMNAMAWVMSEAMSVGKA